MNLEKSPDTNPYTPPQSSSVPSHIATNANYYIVSKRKFFALFFSTFSLYAFYWFYQQWSNWKRRTQEKVWPVPRALFNIFFIHSLFKKIHTDAKLVSNSPLPDLQLPATAYVLAQITTNLIDKFLGEDQLSLTMGIITIMFGLIGWCLWQAQKQANIACGDNEGAQNNKFTALNYMWLVLGIVGWLLFALGVFAIMTGMA